MSGLRARCDLLAGEQLRHRRGRRGGSPRRVRCSRRRAPRWRARGRPRARRARRATSGCAPAPWSTVPASGMSSVIGAVDRAVAVEVRGRDQHGAGRLGGAEQRVGDRRPVGDPAVVLRVHAVVDDVGAGGELAQARGVGGVGGDALGAGSGPAARAGDDADGVAGGERGGGRRPTRSVRLRRRGGCGLMAISCSRSPPCFREHCSHYGAVHRSLSRALLTDVSTALVIWHDRRRDRDRRRRDRPPHRPRARPRRAHPRDRRDRPTPPRRPRAPPACQPARRGARPRHGEQRDLPLLPQPRRPAHPPDHRRLQRASATPPRRRTPRCRATTYLGRWMAVVPRDPRLGARPPAGVGAHLRLPRARLRGARGHHRPGHARVDHAHRRCSATLPQARRPPAETEVPRKVVAGDAGRSRTSCPTRSRTRCSSAGLMARTQLFGHICLELDGQFHEHDRRPRRRSSTTSCASPANRSHLR